MNKKTGGIHIRLTAEQRAKLERLATTTGRTPSGVIRRLLDLVETGPTDLKIEAGE